jgi:hypothetical protein
MAAEVFGGGVPELLRNLTEYIPDDDERRIFGEKLIDEYRTGKSHASLRTYGATAFQLS